MIATLPRAGVLTTVAAVAVSATLLRGQQAPVGYDDTPMQPDGKWRVHDIKRPRPPVVSPGPLTPVAPPSDALVLLGPGNDLSKWQATDGSPASWLMSGGVLETGKGIIRTRAEFADIQLHVEFATPTEVKGNSQERGNSGVFLAGVFEIQVLDSFDNLTYADGQAAAMFNGAELVAPAVVTVFHNGVLVHNARPFWGPTAHRRIAPYIPATARGPVRLQDHGNPVRYRNIWLREL